jgi:hypothetical protein
MPARFMPNWQDTDFKRFAGFVQAFEQTRKGRDPEA